MSIRNIKLVKMFLLIILSSNIYGFEKIQEDCQITKVEETEFNIGLTIGIKYTFPNIYEASIDLQKQILDEDNISIISQNNFSCFKDTPIFAYLSFLKFSNDYLSYEYALSLLSKDNWRDIPIIEKKTKEKFYNNYKGVQSSLNRLEYFSNFEYIEITYKLFDKDLNVVDLISDIFLYPKNKFLDSYLEKDVRNQNIKKEIKKRYVSKYKNQSKNSLVINRNEELISLVIEDENFIIKTPPLQIKDNNDTVFKDNIMINEELYTFNTSIRKLNIKH
jgi:hypothetical protein